MNKYLFLTSMVGAAFAASAFDFASADKVASMDDFNIPAPEVKLVEPIRRTAQTESTLQFTADDPQAHAPVWQDNFDAGISGWTFDPTTYVTWSAKTTSGDKAFSKIDPNDRGSLFVEGPYQVFRREISSATSGEIIVPAYGSLQGYVGYSLNYDDMCRLIVSVSDDDFETSTEVWNSKDGQGGKPWEWRQINADLTPWVGKTVKIRLTYTWGSGDTTFKTGGYMGDFTIDDLRISGLSTVPSVELEAGESVRLICLTPGASNVKWTMPGAVPETSSAASPEVYYTAGGSYDVTLEADVNGVPQQTTISNFVHVTGIAPVAKILPPATFRDVTTYNFMVAPLAPVTFHDASTGFPTESVWIFSGITDGDPSATVEISEKDPTVSFMYRSSWPVGLAVANEDGSSSDIVTVIPSYEGGITNTTASDLATNFAMGDWGVFPGSNTHKITRYAERFSKPSVPMVVGGAYVYFIDAPSEIAVTDNTSVGVHLYTSENGLPGECLESMWWNVIDLDAPTSDGNLVGTWFSFPSYPVVNDEFFIVVDGLPEYSETCKVSFAMAQFRSEGNTALMEIDGVWKEVDDYFGSNCCTSYFITPVVRHSVMTSLPVGQDTVTFDKEGGEATHTIFSYMGYKTPVESDADWCSVISEPNDMTVDELTIKCDPNPTESSRTAHLTLTDGAGTLRLTVMQSATVSIPGIEGADTQLKVYPTVFSDNFTVETTPSATLTIADLCGRTVLSCTASEKVTIDGSSWAPGVYVVTSNGQASKVIKR